MLGVLLSAIDSALAQLKVLTMQRGFINEVCLWYGLVWLPLSTSRIRINILWQQMGKNHDPKVATRLGDKMRTPGYPTTVGGRLGVHPFRWAFEAQKWPQFINSKGRFYIKTCMQVVPNVKPQFQQEAPAESGQSTFSIPGETPGQGTLTMRTRAWISVYSIVF